MKPRRRRKASKAGRVSAGLFLVLVLAGPRGGLAAPAPGADAPSPENQVFQFMQEGVCDAWPDGSSSRATAYLWIPERCSRLRGLVILGANVPEHRLAGHPVLREACARSDLGVLWSVPSFMNFRKDKDRGTDMAREHRTTVMFLQQLLDGLAATSGYEEVATVPWLPIGESGHLLMVDALVEACPQRCIAGVWLKNHHFPPTNRQVPSLVIFGTAQEWSQDRIDIRTKWNDVGGEYESVLERRRSNPGWPLSYLIDGSSGHFDCSDRLTAYIARYVAAAAGARLSADGAPALRPVDLEQGFLADLPVPGRVNRPVTAFPEAAPEARGLPWYFDRAGAEEARSFAAINWHAETQLPAFADEEGNVFPFTFNGITLLSVDKPSDPSPVAPPTPMLKTGADGITFTLKGVLLDRLPANFAGAGEPLARAPGVPEIEWLCGAVTPLGNGTFRMALDRTWPSPIYLAVRHRGTDTIRGVVQPGQIGRDQHTEGLPQTITFEPIPDVEAGTVSVPLVATSDAGMPVRFFVRAGPAIVDGSTLIFTTLPPRARLPLTVTVCAWQWGRSTEPAVRTAPIVEREFRILPR